MAKTIVVPAAIRYQGELASTCASLKAVDYKFDPKTLDTVTAMVSDLQDGIEALETAMESNGFKSTLEHAKHCCDEVLPAMLALRKVGNRLEGTVADDLWPLATYQEMLFIK